MIPRAVEVLLILQASQGQRSQSGRDYRDEAVGLQQVPWPRCSSNVI